jgi:NMD protein affecting ribosome stability and mRNA decay
MAWTCIECGRSEPFDPPARRADGAPMCLECDREATSAGEFMNSYDR